MGGIRRPAAGDGGGPMGKQAIDDDANQTGQMLVALLGVGQATFVSKLELLDNGTRVRCVANS